MEIEKVYERLVKDTTAACKSLGWTFEAEQDVDSLLYLKIDRCEYFVSPSLASTETKPVYYLGVMVPNHGTRWEPPSCDDVTLSNADLERPEHFLSLLLDSHWTQRKQWAMESTIDWG